MAIEVKVVNGVPVPTQVQGTEEAAASETGQLDPKIWEDLDEALESLQEAMPGYLEAEKYYEGTVGEKFINKAVQALLTGSKTDFNVNLAGRVVDAVQDRMEIAAVTAERGMLIVYGALDGRATPLPVGDVLGRSLTVRGYLIYEATHDDAKLAAARAFVLDGLASGTLRPRIDRVFPFDAIADAHGRWKVSNGARLGDRPARSLRARSRLKQGRQCSPASSPTSARSGRSSRKGTCASPSAAPTTWTRSTSERRSPALAPA